MLCRNSTRKRFRINNMLKHDWRRVFAHYGQPKGCECSAETRRGTNLESITCSNTTGVEFLPIMGSPKAVNARDDIVGTFFISPLGSDVLLDPLKKPASAGGVVECPCIIETDNFRRTRRGRFDPLPADCRRYRVVVDF